MSLRKDSIENIIHTYINGGSGFPWSLINEKVYLVGKLTGDWEPVLKMVILSFDLHSLLSFGSIHNVTLENHYVLFATAL